MMAPANLQPARCNCTSVSFAVALAHPRPVTHYSLVSSRLRHISRQGCSCTLHPRSSSRLVLVFPASACPFCLLVLLPAAAAAPPLPAHHHPITDAYPSQQPRRFYFHLVVQRERANCNCLARDIFDPPPARHPLASSLLVCVCAGNSSAPPLHSYNLPDSTLTRSDTLQSRSLDTTLQLLSHVYYWSHISAIMHDW